MEEQRIRVDSRKVELVMADGARLTGEVFLQLQGVHLAGPQRIAELLNGEDVFLPVRLDDGVKLVNLEQVVALYAAAEEELDPLLTLGTEHRIRVVTGEGAPLEARIYVNLPSGNNRAKDFLNQPKRFLLFILGAQVVYLARKRILRVED